VFQKFSNLIPSKSGTEITQTQLSKCISELEEGLAVAQNYLLSFWTQRTECSFKLIAAFALDLVAAPVSQSFVECIFSVCRMLM